MSQLRRAVAYIRVSRDDENPENQLYVIEEWARRHGYEVVPFTDFAVSGATDPFQRPGFKMMLRYMREHGIKTIIVAELERLTRDVEHYEKLKDLRRILGWALEEDVEIISIADQGFTEMVRRVRESLAEIKGRLGDDAVMKPFLRLAEEIILKIAELIPEARIAAAQFERERAAQRTKRALERLKSEGRVYTKPDYAAWLALYRSRKAEFSELTREEIEEAERYLVEQYVKPYLEGVPASRLYRKFLEQEKPVIEFIRRRREAELALRAKLGLPIPYRVETGTSYTSFRRLLKKLASKAK